MLKRVIAQATLIAAVLAAPAALAQERPKEVNFGIISTESTQNLRQDWAVLLEDMQKTLRIKVNAFFAPDYAGIIEGMRFNKVQIAWFGNKSGMEAVDRASGEVIVQQLSAEGHPGYWSLLIAHKDSPYNSLEDVKKSAKRIALGMGDSNSTSGYLVPSYYVMALNNLDARSSFRVMRQANHEANLMAVANKQVDVAVNNTENFDKFERRNPELARSIKVIWKSPLIPNDPMVVRKDLPPAFKAEIRAFFVNYGKDAREKEALKRIHIGGFRESDNNQLLPIRQLELFRAKLQMEKDERMGAAEKQAKLQDIDRQLASLNQQLAALKK